MNRTNKLFLSSTFVLSGLLAGCTAGALTSRNQSLGESNPSASPRPISVRVFDAQPAPRSSGGDLLIPAALSVENTALVLAERDGLVVSLAAREGSRVKQGEVLAQFNDEDQRSQL